MSSANIAIIGFGKMGMLHSGIVNSLPEANLVAVVEPNSTIRNSFDPFMEKVNFYKNTNELFQNEQLDAVFITTPPKSHVSLGLECLERNINFFVEKPLSINSSDCLSLVEAVKGKEFVTMVGFMMRYIPTFRKVKEILSENQLGEVLAYSSRSSVSQLFKKGSGWRYSRKESGGGALITQGIHLVDLLHWYFGDPKSVCAKTKSYYSKEVEDFCFANVEHQNSICGNINSSWSIDSKRLLEIEIEINTSLGSIFVNQDSVKVFSREKTKFFKKGWTTFNITELFTPAVIDIGGTHFTLQDQDFIKSVIDKKTIHNDVEHSYLVQKTIDSIYKSADEGGNNIII